VHAAYVQKRQAFAGAEYIYGRKGFPQSDFIKNIHSPQLSWKLMTTKIMQLTSIFIPAFRINFQSAQLRLCDQTKLEKISPMELCCCLFSNVSHARLAAIYFNSPRIPHRLPKIGVLFGSEKTPSLRIPRQASSLHRWPFILPSALFPPLIFLSAAARKELL
jgi:hypothetical protein